MTQGLELRLQAEALEPGRWYTTREAAPLLGVTASSAYETLMGLRTAGLVTGEMQRRNRRVRCYWYWRRT